MTTEWLAKLMQKNITAHDIVKVLEAGVTSDAAIFSLTYGEGETGPATICLKYAKTTQESRDFAMGGDMYMKELFFYQNLHEDVAKHLSIPHVHGVFIDPEKPDEFFCIAMEDMLASHTAIDQIAGLSYEEVLQLADMAAGFHAGYWQADILKDPVVCSGNPNAAAVFFEQWALMGCTLEGAWDSYYKLALEGACNNEVIDMAPTQADKDAVELMKRHGPAVMAHFHKTLDSRPFTMTHGDMRGDNMFNKKDGSGFSVIDWQTYGAASPGVEMHQLFANQMDNLDDYKRIPELMQVYIDALHAKCPASKDYTYDMLWTDFRMCGAMGSMCMSVALGGIMAKMGPTEPNMILFSKFLPRCRATYTQLNIAGIVIDTCKELGLK